MLELNAIFKHDPSITMDGGRGEPASLSIAGDEQNRYLRQACVIVQNFINGLETKQGG